LDRIDGAAGSPLLLGREVGRSKLQRRFRAAREGKSVICLDIPDNYNFMQPELVQLL
jgi:predicted protein tyrosine phosphatase